MYNPYSSLSKKHPLRKLPLRENLSTRLNTKSNISASHFLNQQLCSQNNSPTKGVKEVARIVGSFARYLRGSMSLFARKLDIRISRMLLCYQTP